MIGFWRRIAAAVAAASLLLATVSAAQAAGAFAVGACGAYGYAYDYKQIAAARTAAAQKCSGTSCKIVGGHPSRLRGARGRCQASLRLVWLGDRRPSRQGREHVPAPLLSIRRARLRSARLGLRRKGLIGP